MELLRKAFRSIIGIHTENDVEYEEYEEDNQIESRTAGFPKSQNVLNAVLEAYKIIDYLEQYGYDEELFQHLTEIIGLIAENEKALKTIKGRIEGVRDESIKKAILYELKIRSQL